MASGGKDKHVNIFDFDPETLQLKFARSLERHNQDYQGVAFFAWSPDSSKLAVCGPEDCDEVRLRFRFFFYFEKFWPFFGQIFGLNLLKRFQKFSIFLPGVQIAPNWPSVVLKTVMRYGLKL